MKGLRIDDEAEEKGTYRSRRHENPLVAIIRHLLRDPRAHDRTQRRSKQGAKAVQRGALAALFCPPQVGQHTCADGQWRAAAEACEEAKGDEGAFVGCPGADEVEDEVQDVGELENAHAAKEFRGGSPCERPDGKGAAIGRIRVKEGGDVAKGDAARATE